VHHGPGAATRTLALIGDPVAHSLSPRIHNAALRHLGIDAVYVALRCDADAAAPLIRALCAAGGGGSVTVPHKSVAAGAVDRTTDAVRRTGACNAFWGEGRSVCGDNTDVHGFRQAAHRLLPDLRGIRVAMAGAGGAAAAAACAPLEDGAAAVSLYNRNTTRARDLAARLDPGGAVISVAADPAAALRGADLVVNATSLGLRDDDPLPFLLHDLAPAVALDLVYRPGGATPWVRHARDAGFSAADGTHMLLAQAAAAFRNWFGVEPPMDVMSAALGPG
jgi:shikimate dehydrogenase